MDVKEKLVELVKRAIIDLEHGDASEWIADYLIAHGVTVQEWISVKDRLPKYKDGKVLAFTQYGYTICQRTRNGRWKGQYSNWITDWAYLPPPPETEYGYLQNVMTNADHIRNMTDKELAEFLTHINPTNCQECAFSHGRSCQPDRDDYSDFEKCEEGRKRWLQQPPKGE